MSLERLPAPRRQPLAIRCRARREQLERFSELLPEIQGQNLDLTVIYVLNSLDSGPSVQAIGFRVGARSSSTGPAAPRRYRGTSEDHHWSLGTGLL